VPGPSEDVPVIPDLVACMAYRMYIRARIKHDPGDDGEPEVEVFRRILAACLAALRQGSPRQDTTTERGRTT